MNSKAGCSGLSRMSRTKISQGTLNIINPLKDVFATESKVALLQCEVHGNPCPACSWYNDGNPIISSERIKTMTNINWHRLEIHSLAVADQGTYRFACKNNAIQKSTHANLFVTPADPARETLYYRAVPRASLEVVKHLIDVKVKVGQMIQLEAKFQTSSVAEFTWYKQNEVLVTDGRTLLLNSMNQVSLRRKPARMADTGFYFIMAKTACAHASSFATVVVTDVTESSDDTDMPVPFVDEFLPEEIETNEGDDVRITCKAICDLHTNIWWSKNVAAINDSRLRPQDYGSNYVGLTIMNATKADVDVYTVHFQNTMTGAYDSCSCFLQVLRLPTNEKFTRVLVKRPVENVMASCGAKIVLSCSFFLNDPSRYYFSWAVGHHKVESSNSRFTVIQRGQDCILCIKKLEQDMAGPIICELRQLLPNQTTLSVSLSTARITIVPFHALEVLRTSGTDAWKGPMYEDSNEPVVIRICNQYKNVNIPAAEQKAMLGMGMHVMDITYCRFEKDDRFYLLVSEGKGDVVPTSFSVHKKLLDEPRAIAELPPSSDPNPLVFQWTENIAPARVWYNIYLGTADNTCHVGVSSVPKIQFSEPPVGEILKLSVYSVKPTCDSETSTVCVVPALEEPLPPQYDKELKDMSLFGAQYTTITGEIAAGAFGSLTLVKNDLGQKFAAKTVRTSTHSSREKALNEYQIWLYFNHPKIVNLVEVFFNDDAMVFVMEYLRGGELFTRISEDENIKEADVVKCVKQICEALVYMHSLNIVHMDIKPENVLYVSPNSEQIKIIDFGLARMLNDNETIAATGTPSYIAPEILRHGHYNAACDMWSLGVVTYKLLSGRIPFYAETWDRQKAVIRLGRYNYNDPAFKKVSDLGKDFINKLLVMNPANRMTATAALNHLWIVEGPPG